MVSKLTFFPVGNGDMTLVPLESGRKVLLLDGDRAQISPHQDSDYNIDMVVFANDQVIRAPHNGSREARPSMPRAGEIIRGYVCRPDRLEAVIGDLERNFRKRAIKHGVAAARRWYWWQVVRSVGAFGIKLLQSAELVDELLRKLGL
jgi:hypothetical protein